MKWEYQYLPVSNKKPPEETVKALNGLGEKGWEMAGCLPSEMGSVIILKRQVTELANAA
jgi:hypothetical protein